MPYAGIEIEWPVVNSHKLKRPNEHSYYAELLQSPLYRYYFSTEYSNKIVAQWNTRQWNIFGKMKLMAKNVLKKY